MNIAVCAPTERIAVCTGLAICKRWTVVRKAVLTQDFSENLDTWNSLFDAAQKRPRQFDGIIVPDLASLCSKPAEGLLIFQRLRDLQIRIFFADTQQEVSTETRAPKKALDDICKNSMMLLNCPERFSVLFSGFAEEIQTAAMNAFACASYTLSSLNFDDSSGIAITGRSPGFILTELAHLYPRGAAGTRQAVHTTYKYLKAGFSEARSAHRRGDLRAKDRVYKEFVAFGCTRSYCVKVIEGTAAHKDLKKLLGQYIPPFFPDHKPGTIRRYFDHVSPKPLGRKCANCS
jgi:nucleoside diphosphate kinase